ncbi:hypothetical protein ONZ45_g11234 [Pleurotus djamor]|nr:hypothetical protein ONZ45_g11234 [Pleurotus djamor]
MVLSAVGKKQFAAHLSLFVVNLIVLGLAAKVNEFQEFFYAADLFPLALSIITLTVLVALFILDFAIVNSYSGRPQFLIPLFAGLSVFWLAFNAFSTSRWRFVPLECDSIPDGFPETKGWCKNLQALKAFVWIEWVICLLITLVTLRFTITQNTRGHKHIFNGPLSRYKPTPPGQGIGYNFGGPSRGSEFLQY